MKIRALMLGVLCLGSTACTLQGVPVGLKPDESHKIEVGTLDQNLAVGRDLSQRWEECRNSADRYAFWSNAALIPLAAGGATAALYKGSKDLITGIGIAAGTLIGTNTFLGAPNIASAYQSGINGLSCVTGGLGSYSTAGTKPGDATQLKTDTDLLEAALPHASATLAASTGLDLTSAAAVSERTANPSVMSTLANNEKALNQAISDAQSAITASHTELHLFKTLSSYSRDRILDVNRIVAAKIKPSTVNYATLSASILQAGTPATPKPVAAIATPAPRHGARVATAPAAGGATPTPIADAADATKTASDQLQGLIKTVTTETTDFDLTAQETTIAACIKNL